MSQCHERRSRYSGRFMPIVPAKVLPTIQNTGLQVDGTLVRLASGTVTGSGFLAFSFSLHLGKRGVSAFFQGNLDAFHQQIVDFASFVKGDLL